MGGDGGMDCKRRIWTQLVVSNGALGIVVCPIFREALVETNQMLRNKEGCVGVIARVCLGQ
jgi:hypothetical protein